jgi:HAD superfamily hydrolase (TIGR01509 family)
MTADRPAGVLFDVDGTLVDTTYLHTVCWWEALRQQGHDIPMARIHRAIGMGSDKLLDHLIGSERDRGADGRMRHSHDALFGEYFDRLRPFPGAAELLRSCAARGLTVVLASSASEREMRALRAALRADDAVAAATSSADADESKPAPDIVAAALEEAGLEPADALFVGDTVWDVAAAGQLSIGCVAVTCGGTSRAELVDAGATGIYDGPADLLANFDRSPLAQLA